MASQSGRPRLEYSSPWKFQVSQVQTRLTAEFCNSCMLHSWEACPETLKMSYFLNLKAVCRPFSDWQSRNISWISILKCLVYITSLGPLWVRFVFSTNVSYLSHVCWFLTAIYACQIQAQASEIFWAKITLWCRPLDKLHNLYAS